MGNESFRVDLNFVQNAEYRPNSGAQPPQASKYGGGHMNARGIDGRSSGWEDVASLSMLGLIGMLWRQLPIMIIVFIALFALGIFGAMGLKKEYTAQGRILVQYGEEYIYNPVIGTAGRGTAYSTDEMIQAEVGFFTAAILRERVLQKIGLRRLYPKLAASYELNPISRDQVMGKALEEMGKNLGAYTAPNQPLISVSFRHANPEISALVLNAIIDEYLVYRREILLDDGNSQYGNERKNSEVKLTEINTKLSSFLAVNGIGDFLAEQMAAGTRYATLSDQLLAAKTRQREVDAGIRAHEDRLAMIPEQILLYTEDNSSVELTALQIEREQLLSRYKPGSKPVQAIDANIKRLQSFIAAGKNRDMGAKRTGVNLVHQTLQSEKLSLESEAQSIKERISILGSQISQVRAKQRKLQRLFPEYQRLAGKVTVLQSAVQRFSTREEQYAAKRNLAEHASNNIRVIEHPVIPFEGKSMKRPAAILAFLFAGFTALMLGLAIVFSQISRRNRQRPVNPGGGYSPPYQPQSQPPSPSGGMPAQTPYNAAPTTSSMNNGNINPAMASANTAYHERMPPLDQQSYQNNSRLNNGSAVVGGKRSTDLPVIANIGRKTGH
ncbi:MAG: hypothetical protein JKY46_04085 [Robiginitomaculum sp.]|nr:hypothetical protein [Robiginitomaculum sp.]